VLGKELSPVLERPVRTDAERLVLIRGGHDAEEELGAGVVHGREANFVDQDEVGLHDLLDDPADRVVGEPAVEGLDEIGGAEVAHPLSLLDGAVSEGDQEMGLARPCRYSDRLQQFRRVLPCEVRVISTTHPLFGRLLQATGFKRWKGDVLLVVMLPDGSPGTIPASATNILGGDIAAGLTTVLSVEGVRQLRVLVHSLKPARRSPSRPKTRK
jgi:hypothetical protein